MEIKDLIELIEKDSIPESIIIPEFQFNNESIKNTEFIKMGLTPCGKVIYQSKEGICRTSMDSLLRINGRVHKKKGIGECDICKEAERSLDEAVYSVLGAHLQYYKRFYIKFARKIPPFKVEYE